MRAGRIFRDQPGEWGDALDRARVAECRCQWIILPGISTVERLCTGTPSGLRVAVRLWGSCGFRPTAAGRLPCDDGLVMAYAEPMGLSGIDDFGLFLAFALFRMGRFSLSGE